MNGNYYTIVMGKSYGFMNTILVFNSLPQSKSVVIVPATVM